MVSRDLFGTLSYPFVFFFCPQFSGNFLKNSLFQKKTCKNWVFNFQCFKFKFWKFSFFGLQKHYKNRGFSNFLCFVLLKEKKTGKNDNWNLWIWFFLVQKWPFRDAQLLFKKKALKQLFLLCFLCARFLGQVVTKGKIWTPSQKRRKFSLITEKLIFEYFLFFLVFLFFFFFLFFFLFLFFLVLLFFLLCFFWRV